MKLLISEHSNIYGSVNISGAKNSAVAIIPAATLTNKKVILQNIPNIKDVELLIKTLNHQGFKTTFINNTLTIKRKLFIKKTFNKFIDKLRGSYYFIGAFISKYKKINFGEYGGCNLGDRPINYHLNAFKEKGIIITQTNKYLKFKSRKIKDAIITLPFQSVGATINLLLSSVISNKTTIINNASIEPEVIDVGNFLITMGANITNLGTKTITIHGVKKLKGCTYKIIPDRIEAATYLSIGALTSLKGLTINSVNFYHLFTPLLYFKKIGCKLEFKPNSITIFKPKIIKSVDIKTGVYPLFPTDLNPIFCALLLNADGISTITETIYKERTSHINELKKLGATLETIQTSDNLITKIFPSLLHQSNLSSHDLRCAASLLVASFHLNSCITISNIDYLLRGYEDPISKLKNIGIHTSLINES